MKYKVSFIDGFDMRYKTRVIAAGSKEEAIHKVWAEHIPEGDFDHQIVDVKESEE